jgi:hypothetical protein
LNIQQLSGECREINKNVGNVLHLMEFILPWYLKALDDPVRRFRHACRGQIKNKR